MITPPFEKQKNIELLILDREREIEDRIKIRQLLGARPNRKKSWTQAIARLWAKT